MKRFFIALSTTFTIGLFSWLIWWGLEGLSTEKIIILSIPIVWSAFTFDVFVTAFISLIAEEINGDKK
jgi:hypothetical protein